MATAPETLALERVHQAAQARLGIAAAFMALAEWENVHALKNEDDAAATAWLVVSLRILTAVQKMSRELAISYYQLNRALETGRTLGAPINSPETDVTLGQLRKTFRNYALDVAALPSPHTLSSDPDIRWFEEQLKERDMPDAPNRLVRLEDAQVDPLIQNLLDVEGSNNSEPVTIDKFTWEPPMTFEQVDEEFRDLLRKQAIERSVDKTKALRSSTELTPGQALRQIEESHAAAGSIGSGTVDALGMEGGRQAIDTAIRKDKRIKLVARGTGPDPCAFCAMLASRGFVYTGTTSGVGDGTEGEEIKKFHVNCHCYPIVRFVNTSDTLPPINAYFQEKWYEVTANYSGHDAVKAWRRWIYAQRKANPLNPHGFATTTT
jgi:hypothetical protein